MGESTGEGDEKYPDCGTSGCWCKDCVVEFWDEDCSSEQDYLNHAIELRDEYEDDVLNFQAVTTQFLNILKISEKKLQADKNYSN